MDLSDETMKGFAKVAQERWRMSAITREEWERKQVPVTLVEHMTDPRAAQLQMLFASLDERGKKTIVALAATMVKLHKDINHE